jgi:hypothetical protein
MCGGGAHGLRVALFETVWPRYELAGEVMLLLVGSGWP